MRQAIQKPPDRPVYHLPALSGPGWPQYLQGVKDWWRGDTGSEPGGDSQIHSDITDYHRDRNNTSERRRVYVQISDSPAALQQEVL